MATPAEDLANNIGKVNVAFTNLGSVLGKTTSHAGAFTVAIEASTKSTVIFTRGINDLAKKFDNFSKKQLDNLVKASDKVIIGLGDLEKKLNNFNPSGGGGGGDKKDKGPSVEALFFAFDSLKQVANEYFKAENIRIQQTEQQYKLTQPMLDTISITQNIFGKLNNSVMSMVDQLDKLQQTALAMGTSFEFTKTALTGAGIDKIGGLGINLKDLENSLTLYSQGFRQSNKNVLNLAKIMDMTGQKTSVLLEGLTRMSISLGMNNAQLNALAGIIDKTSLDNKVTSEQLIETISQLKIKDTLGVLGIGGNFAAGMAQATAQFPQLRESMLLVANSLSDPKTVMNLIAYDSRFGQLARQLEAGGDFVQTFKSMAGGMQGFINMIRSASTGATGLPGTTMATMFASPEMMPVLNAFIQIFQQMNSVSTERLLQLQTEAAYSKSLTAQMQELQSALMPLAVAILNVTSSKIKELGAGAKLVNAFVRGTKELLALKISALDLQIKQLVFGLAIATVQIAISAWKLVADIGFAGMSMRLASLGIIGLAFGAVITMGALGRESIEQMNKTKGIMQSTGGIFDDLNKGLTIEHDATRDNTRATEANTAALTGDGMRIRSTGQNSYFSVLAKSIEYTLTEQKNNVTALAELQAQGKITNEFLQKLLQATTTGLDVQIRNMGSQFGGGR